MAERGPSAPERTAVHGTVTTIGATALGIGGMMGAGLFTLLGLGATAAGTLLPLAFLLAAVAVSGSVYSLARLGERYPSRGGSAEFLRVALGNGVLSRGLNIFTYVEGLFGTALCAAGFSEYVRALGGAGFPAWATRAAAAGVIIVFTAVNAAGASRTVRAASLITIAVTVTLVGFVLWGSTRADPGLLKSQPRPDALGVVAATAVLYVAYQGFAVVTNSADRMTKPTRQIPRAMFGALAVVALLYVAVSAIVVMLVPVPQLITDAAHALADAGRAVAGQFGFTVISIAAILSTASAVNSTLFSTSNIGYQVAAMGQIPPAYARNAWRQVPWILVGTAVGASVLVAVFPLSSVGLMTSMAGLLVYGSISAAHLRVHTETGARPWILVAAVVVNAVLFCAVFGYALLRSPAATWLTLLACLVGSFAFAAVYRRVEDRRQTSR